MARPVKIRRIMHCPNRIVFRPAGKHDASDNVKLSIDEYEALRLANLESMYHADAAIQMGISRQTFGNILRSANHKIADAVVNGKPISIEGIGGENNAEAQCTECDKKTKKLCRCREEKE